MPPADIHSVKYRPSQLFDFWSILFMSWYIMNMISVWASVCLYHKSCLRVTMWSRTFIIFPTYTNTQFNISIKHNLTQQRINSQEREETLCGWFFCSSNIAFELDLVKTQLHNSTNCPCPGQVVPRPMTIYSSLPRHLCIWGIKWISSKLLK